MGTEQKSGGTFRTIRIFDTAALFQVKAEHRSASSIP